MPVALFDARDGRNVFLMLRRRWAPGRRRCRDAGAMPLPQLLAARRAAALHNAAIVDVLLGLEGVWADLSILRPWSVRRWLQLRATCTTARDALPLLLQEDTLTDFCNADPSPFTAGHNPGPVRPPRELCSATRAGLGALG